MKNIFLTALFWVTNTIIFAQNIEKPLSYITHKTNEKILIDGKANENIWKKVPFTSYFVDIEGKKTPKYQTQVKMLWDENYWYFYAQMEEPHVWATLKERDTVIFHNNDFEIFIDPNGDTHQYYEFEMNALNTIWDLFLVKPYRESSSVIDGWNIEGLLSAVYVDGTLNNSKDIDKGWSVEIAIPWKVFRTSYGQDNVPRNDFWRVNFSRVNWDFDLIEGKYSRKKDKNGKLLPEYNWVWSPQWVINMHEPEKWGYVFFTEKSPENEVIFEIPKDEYIKWYMYKLYRKSKEFTQKDFKNFEKMAIQKQIIQGKSILPKLEKHSLGWNLSVKSPFTGKTLIIKEDGLFLTK